MWLLGDLSRGSARLAQPLNPPLHPLYFERLNINLNLPVLAFVQEHATSCNIRSLIHCVLLMNLSLLLEPAEPHHNDCHT